LSHDLRAWLSAFLFTQAVEVPIYVVALRRWGDRARFGALPVAVAVGFGASLLTHPIVWFEIPRMPFRSYGEMVAFAETFAVVAEGLYLYAVGAFVFRRAMLVSLLANGASASLGLVLRELVGWP
jgi:hypothetical protein